MLQMMRPLIIVAILALFPGVAVLAQQPENDQETERKAEEPAQAPVQQKNGDPEIADVREGETGEESDETGASPESVERNPCEVVTAGDEARLDKFRREVFESVCESAAWFDSFFGSRRFDQEARQTHGRVGARLVFDEHEGIELDGTLKVKVDFPNLDHRVNAFLGREDEGDFLAGTESELDFLPTFFEREGGQEWLLGLGYRPVGGDRSSLDFDVGVDIETPLDPFVRARYRRYWPIGDDYLLRAQQSVYWTNQRDVGTGTRVDLEKPIGSRTLARWAGNVVHDSETEGADWDTGVTLYHGFNEDRAIAWFVGIDGETGRQVPIKDYGTRFIYRQRMLREWFFGELITGVTWPRDHLDEQRELAWHFGFGFEIQFSGEALGLGF